MLALRLLERVPDGSWRDLVERCGGHPLHLPQVHLGDRSEKSLRYLVFHRAQDEVACAPAFVSTPSLHRLRGRPRLLTLPTSPAVAAGSAAERREIYGRLIEGCRAMGCRRLAVEHAWGDDLTDIPPLAASITIRVVEFVLDLQPPLDDLLAGMHKAHRKNIRRAEKLGLQVRAETSLTALEELRRLQQVSALRSAERGGGFAVRDAAYYRRVHERVYGTGIGEVLLAYSGEACVGALAYLQAAGKGITVRSGCTSAGYESYAMYLLHHALLGRAKALGLRRLNLGGVPAEAEGESHPQHGLYEFKRGFGGVAQLRTAVEADL